VVLSGGRTARSGFVFDLHGVVFVSPRKNTRATGNRTVATVPISIAPRFVCVCLLQLSTLGTVSDHETLREHFPATVIPLAA
jgi:hypothetical protein